MDIKSIRNLYNQIPKTDVNSDKRIIAPVNQELMDKSSDQLTKQPQIAPNLTKKHD